MNEDMKSALATGVASMALHVKVLQRLMMNNLITLEEMRDTVEASLLVLETMQASVPAEIQPVYETARSILDAALPEVRRPEAGS